jgi:hypothetical protein
MLHGAMLLRRALVVLSVMAGLCLAAATTSGIYLLCVLVVEEESK